MTYNMLLGTLNPNSLTHFFPGWVTGVGEPIEKVLLVPSFPSGVAVDTEK